VIDIELARSSKEALHDQAASARTLAGLIPSAPHNLPAANNIQDRNHS